MSNTRKIQVTKNYRMFLLNQENRPVDVKKHRKLLESMKLYGFLPCFPIVCGRDDQGHLIVKDGQHRLSIAESLGLSVCWVEETIDFDIATINCTAKVWAVRDYAEKYALNGKKDYQEGLEFQKAHGLPMATSFALLSGRTAFSNIANSFYAGDFKVKDRRWADAVAGVYGPIAAMSPVLKSARFIEACMAVCRVKDFDAKRLLANTERCREKLVSYSTRDAYLDMIEVIYNFGRSKLVSLKIEAMKVMRERKPMNKKKVDAAQVNGRVAEKVA